MSNSFFKNLRQNQRIIIVTYATDFVGLGLIYRVDVERSTLQLVLFIMARKNAVEMLRGTAHRNTRTCCFDMTSLATDQLALQQQYNNKATCNIHRSTEITGISFRISDYADYITILLRRTASSRRNMVNRLVWSSYLHTRTEVDDLYCI